MKLAALILSFYFMLFSAQPVLAAVPKMKDCGSSCSRLRPNERKSAPHESHHKNESPAKQDNEKCPACNCTIFQCAFCSGVVMEESSFGFSLFSKSAASFPQTDLILHSSYASDCWQPPELV